MSKREVILAYLAAHPEGAYGLDMVKASGGMLSAGSVYADLSRLEAEGKVYATKDEPSEPGALPRYRYRLTEPPRP